MTEFNKGDRVVTTVVHEDYKHDDELLGTIVDPNPARCPEFVLINFGARFAGHDGLPDSDQNYGVGPTCWFVMRQYVRPAPIAPAAEPSVDKAPAEAKQQTDRILAHLLSGHSITQLEAFGVFRIFRLAARIHELKRKGHKIITAMKRDATGKLYAEYSLVSRRLR